MSLYTALATITDQHHSLDTEGPVCPPGSSNPGAPSTTSIERSLKRAISVYRQSGPFMKGANADPSGVLSLA